MSINYQIKKGLLGGYAIGYGCPSCSTALKSPLDEAGKIESCPECGTQFTVPGAKDHERIRSAEALAARTKQAEKVQEERRKQEERRARNDASIARAAELARQEAARQAIDATEFKDTRACPYCGEDILIVAKKCRFCGEFLTDEFRKQPSARQASTSQQTKAGTSNSTLAGGCLFAFLIFGFLLYIAGPTDSNSDSTSSEPTIAASHDKTSAWVMAQGFVEKRLKSPSTASYGGIFSGDYQMPDVVVTDLGGGKYKVNAWVDSQNSFGATLRSHFICELEYAGNDNWRCTNLVLVER